MEAVDFGFTYKYRRDRFPNESAGRSALLAGSEWALHSALWYVASPIMWSKTMAELGFGLGPTLATAYKQGPSTRPYNPNVGGNYFDTELNATMRQRAMSAIQNSRMNARSVLGNEARSLHGGRRWF